MLLAYLIYLMNELSPHGPEGAVKIVAACFAILLALPPGIYLLCRRSQADPSSFGLIVLSSFSVLLLSVYIYRISFIVLFPADILIWSESDFINDILKFRVGYPIYSSQENNESFTYTPGAQLITYLLAALMGKPASLSAYRMLQLVYTLLAAVVGVACCWRLIKLSVPPGRFQNAALWGVLFMLVLLLIATNFLTNPYVGNLHNDALAQLLSILAYYLLLRYISAPDKRILAVMSVVPAVGFLVKQSLLIWGVLYCVYLGFFHRPYSSGRVVGFALAVFANIAVVIGGCYLIWGEHFIYWIFTVMGNHPVSVLRALQHITDVWAYLMIGLVGGLALLRGMQLKVLLGPWLVWLCLFLIQAYTSGVAWMLNHLGPGSLIAGIWFLAGLSRVWSSSFQKMPGSFWTVTWHSAGLSVVAVAVLFSGLGMVRLPLAPFHKDAYRYVEDIQKEFAGQSAANILLDAGTWNYLNEMVVMKDRAPSIGERGFTATGNFSGMIQRLEEKRYAKIMVRNAHSPDFWYDHQMWRKSSGIRKSLMENYLEIRRIPRVSPLEHQREARYLFNEISVFIPKPR
jgi:hypothetical protein